MIVGYTTGVFDMFHVGHLNILKQAKEQCDYLIVGVSLDELVMKEKKKLPIIPYEDRVRIINALECVDKVVPQENKDKMEAWQKYKFDKMFVGSDWKGTATWEALEKQFEPLGVEIIYFNHTDGISSTILRDRLIEIYGVKES